MYIHIGPPGREYFAWVPWSKVLDDTKAGSLRPCFKYTRLVRLRVRVPRWRIFSSSSGPKQIPYLLYVYCGLFC
jgi:hypothetical protein